MKKEAHARSITKTQEERRPNANRRPVSGVINVIVSSAETWANSKSKRKSHLRSVMAVDVVTKRPKHSDWSISFNEDDTELLSDQGNDPIVVSATIGNYHVHRILIDNGSAVEILQWDAFLRMGFTADDLIPSSPIYGFANQPIPVKGTVSIPVTIGDGEHTVNAMVDFLVVDQPSAYNAIFGHPLMKKLKMITAVYCLMVKFPTPTGVGYMRSDQKTARQCHVISIEMATREKGDTSGKDPSTAVHTITPAQSEPSAWNIWTLEVNSLTKNLNLPKIPRKSLSTILIQSWLPPLAPHLAPQTRAFSQGSFGNIPTCSPGLQLTCLALTVR